MKRSLAFFLALILALCMGALPALAEEPIHLVFWHGMGGNNGEIINHIVDTFNSSQDRIVVEAQYQGSYEESINKLKAAMRTQDGPDLVQIYEAGTRFMVDSGFIIPMQRLIDAYDIDVSKLEKHILDFYTINGQLYSMPLNTSVPVCYYNKTLLSQIGWENGPQTWEDIETISKLVIEKGLAEWGISLSTNMWWFEQVMVQQHYAMIDQENGRNGPATRATFADGPLALQIAQKWNDLYQNGYAANTGFSVNDNRTVFWAGLAPMTFDSSGSLKSYLQNVDGSFEIGVCFFPALTAEAPNGGVTLGGASVYMLDNGKGDENDAAIAEFVKWMISPEMQAYFHINSGYYPITTEAYELDSVKENLAAYPQFQTIIDELHFSENMGFGPIYGTFTEGRATYQMYFEQMMQGQLTPEECIEKSAADIDALIADYNLANQK